MEDSEKELEAFAYVASHDMREPLRKILAFGSILAENMEGKLDEESAYCLSGMQDAAVRLATMLDALLLYSRAARSTESEQGCRLQDVVDEAMDELKESGVPIEEAELHIGKLPWVGADPAQMKVLFCQLLDNACKFKDPRRPLRIDLGVDEAGYVYVRDNGQGFAPELLPQMFSLFGRLHGRGEGYTGNGLGLAVCRKIMKALGGSIEASGKPGEGAEFRLSFPRSRPASL